MTTGPASAPAGADRVVPVLQVRTRVSDEQASLLELLPAHAPLAWVQDGQGLVGWGEAARLEISGPEPFEEAADWWAALSSAATVEDVVRRPGTGLIAFGSFAFDPLRGTSVLVVPQVVAGQRDGVRWVTTIGPEPSVVATPPRRPVGLELVEDAERDGAWMATVARAVARIADGALEKVVLARDLVARADEPVDVRWPLVRLAADYPSCWAFHVDGLLGATPELLVRLDRGTALSRVLAGTLRKSGDSNEDNRRGVELARSIKDVEEHGYGVRSVVDALAPHCADVEVPAAPFVLELHNVMHLATDVRGRVTDGASSFDLLQSLHPSAAVCGSPTEVALELIREVEPTDRGRYAGPVGWLDASGDGEWGIALRCGEVDPADPCRLRLFAGCGIVAGSEPARELAESNAKLIPMRDALTA